MGRKYKIHDQQETYFITCTIVNWIDLFIRDEYRQIIIDSLNYCIKEKGLKVYCYCIMTSHLHLIVSADNNLSDIIRDFKSFTSLEIRKAVEEHSGESRKEWLLWMFKYSGKDNSRNKGFQVWQQHNHPIVLDKVGLLGQKIDYIHNNPLVGGFVTDPSYWQWSSCNSYENEVEDIIDLVYL